MPPEPLRDKSIVVTGVTGQVAEPVAMALAEDNQVVGAARFKDQAARDRLEEAGIRCVPIDLVTGDVGGLPADADYVINFAVSKTNDWERDLQANSGGLAWLMEHHQNATAFVHCSTTGVYKPLGHHVFAEDDELGDNHGVWPFLRTYSISKIAAEATARWARPALRAAHHGGPPVGPLRRPGRLAGHPPRDDDQRQSRSPCTSTPRASTTPSTRTTSSPWCPGCSARPPRRPPRSTGAATRRSASRSGAATSPS